MSAERPAAPVRPRPSQASLRRAIRDRRACERWEAATQAVMGEGPKRAEVMLVGETPGDREDLEGHPFVGPAGGVLDRGMKRAGISRDDVYLTNSVTALLGPQVRIGRDRGQRFQSNLAELVTLTTHPSAILRTPDEDRDRAMEQFVTGLREVVKWLNAR